MTDKDSSLSIYTGPSNSTTSDLIPLMARMSRIFRHRKTTLYTTICCFAVVGIAYYCLATRFYESSAKLLIVEQNLDQVSTVGDHDSIGKTMATHRELVISPIVIEQAIKKLAPEHRIDLEGIQPKNWVKRIAEQLNAKISRKTNFIEVSFKSRKPQAAVAVVRAVIDSYLAFVAENHKGAAGQIVQLLASERTGLQKELNTLQETMQKKRKELGHLSVSEDDGIVDPLIQRAVSLNEALIEAQENRLSLQAARISAEESHKRGEDISQHLMDLEETLGRQLLLSSLGLGQQDMEILSEQQKQLLLTQQELKSLSVDLGPNHPRILELTEQIQSHQTYLATYHGNKNADPGVNSLSANVAINMLRQAERQAQAREQQLKASFLLARTAAAQHSDSLVHLHMLERDVARTETLYDSLSVKIANLDLTQVQAPINATIVSEPVANPIPVSPQLRFVTIACLLGGTFLGGIIIYVQDLLDDRFTSPEELSSQLGVPVLAMVQKLDLLPGEGLETVHTRSMPNATETEAFRTLRTSLSVGNNICDRILISSSEPGDGKTTISANLSVTFAQAGKRTLVIDADLRRPGFTTLLNLKGQPGVAEVLTSDLPAAEIATELVQQTIVEGLDILPIGQRRPNPSELLSSQALVELLAWADTQYDRVIIDCPPVLAVSDAQIVGQLVDGVILVVRPEKNHRRSVMRAVESFQSSGCHVLGVVANGLSESSLGYGYGYSYGYGHAGYSDDYGHTDETIPMPEPTSSTNAPLPPLVPATVSFSEHQQAVNASDTPPSIRPRRAA